MDITAADADRDFPNLLDAVRQGQTYTVTSDGRPVARIVPVTAEQSKVEDKAALDALLAWIKSQPVRHIGSWTRDELYDRE